MPDETQKPLQEPLKTRKEDTKAPLIKPQGVQPSSKPDKDVRVPKYHLENFSGRGKRGIE
jgi:hypothetical protein